MDVRFNLDQFVVTRVTYNLLEWLGDLGGLNDALFVIGGIIVSPFIDFGVANSILNSLYMVKPRAPTVRKLRRRNDEEQKMNYLSDRNREKLHKNMRFRDLIRARFKDVEALRSMGLIEYLFTRNSYRSRYKRLLKLSNVKYVKEMDLTKFIMRQRYLTYAVLGLLRGQQTAFITKLSYPVLRESTDTETMSEDESKVNWAKDALSYLERMQVTDDPVNRRILQLFEIKRQNMFGEDMATNFLDNEPP